MSKEIIVATILLVTPVFAAADGDLYIAVNSGVSVPVDADLEEAFGLSGEASFDPGFNIGGAIGYRFVNQFRVEGNMSYRQSDVDEVELEDIPFQGAGDIGVISIMANGYWEGRDLVQQALGDESALIYPYIGGGFGIGIVRADSDSDADVIVVDDESTEFAWNAMAGLSVELTDNLVLDAGYRYLGTTDPEFDAEIPVGFPTRLESEVDIHEFVAGVRYNFP